MAIVSRVTSSLLQLDIADRCHSQSTLRASKRQASLDRKARPAVRTAPRSMFPHIPYLYTPGHQASMPPRIALGSEVVGVSALLLAAIFSTGWQAGIALPANHFFAIVFAGQGFQGGFNDTSTKT